ITDNSFVDSIEVTINVTEDPGNGHFNVSNLTKNLNAVSIYPNPANSLLTIELSSVHPSLDIVIYDMMGRSVQKFEVPENGLMKAPQFDISQLSAGVYLIELRAENATITQRISVQ